jgi:hypothetical protein
MSIAILATQFLFPDLRTLTHAPRVVNRQCAHGRVPGELPPTRKQPDSRDNFQIGSGAHHPVMRFGVRNLNCGDRDKNGRSGGASRIPFRHAHLRTLWEKSAQNPRKSMCMLRVCDHRHRQVYTCRAICTCELGIAGRHTPVPDDCSHLVQKSFSSD